MLRAVAPAFQRVHEQGVKRRNSSGSIDAHPSFDGKKETKGCTLFSSLRWSGGSVERGTTRGKLGAELFIVFGSLSSANPRSSGSKGRATIQVLASKYMLTVYTLRSGVPVPNLVARKYSDTNLRYSGVPSYETW